MKKYLIFSILLVLPLLLINTGSLLTESKGPYWLAPNQDPEYAYLFNALNVATLTKIGHTDHPGTPVQVIGGIALRLLNINASSSTLAEEVIRDPEYYLSILNKIFSFINFNVLLITGVAMYFLTKDIALSLLMQLSPFFYETILDYGLTRVSPEPLLLSVTLLFALFLIMFSFSDIQSTTKAEGIGIKITHKGFVTIFALLAGFGVATKLTFLPLLVIPLVLLTSIKSRVQYLFGTLFSFVLFTLPIISQYDYFFIWLYNVFSHTGFYGSGMNTIIDSTLYLTSVKELLEQNIVYSMIVLSSFIVLAIKPSIYGHKTIFDDKKWRLLLGLALSHVTSILMVAKHPGQHYLLPSLTLAGFTMVLCILNLRPVLDYYRLPVKSSVIIISLMILSVLTVQGQNIHNLYRNNTATKNELFKIYVKDETDYPDYARIYYYRSSSPYYALEFGDLYSYRKYAHVLSKYYNNNVFFYDIWRRQYNSWTETIKLQDLVTKYGRKIIFHGTSFRNEYSQFAPELPLKADFSINNEIIYIADKGLR